MKVSPEAKKELNKFLKNSLSGLQDVVSDATQFAKKELPEVAKEIIMFNGIVNNLFGVLIAIVIGTLNYKLGAWALSQTSEHGEWYISLILTVPIAIGCFIAGVSSLQDALKARVAPRLYLLEYTKQLLKDGDE